MEFEYRAVFEMADFAFPHEQGGVGFFFLLFFSHVGSLLGFNYQLEIPSIALPFW